MGTIVVFEDRGVSDLSPVTLSRPAFTISCGGYRLVDQLLAIGDPVCGLVRPHIKKVFEGDFPELQTAPDASRPPILLVNARLAPSVAVRRELSRLLEAGRPGIVHGETGVAAALLSTQSPSLPSPLAADTLARFLEEAALDPLQADLPLFEFPHDIIRSHLATFRENLEQRLAEGEYREIADGVFAAKGASLGEHVVCDTGGGPVVLDAGASIGPHAFLEGPLLVGRNARVNEHAAIKDCVSLGHTTKVGGEVEASIIEPYSNKQHYGFLGHSYLGSWINIGAGTCNSDLKNTYGLVNMQYGSRKVSTQMQFVGAIVGDYVKTAINTSIFTGKTIGVGSMMYGFVTTNVPSFVNYARSFGQMTEMPVEVMVTGQARMFARRKVTQRPADIQLLHDIYDLTKNERESQNVASGLLAL